jgi:hypothetical protein
VVKKTARAKKARNKKIKRAQAKRVTTLAVEPICTDIKGAMAMTNLGRSSVMEKLRTGAYKAKKSGRRTLILISSIKADLASLPDATFAPPREERRSPAGVIG